MDRSNTKLDYTDVQVPEKVTVSLLDYHFQVKYELGEEQAKALVTSSCESLNDFLSDARSLLTAHDKDMEYEPIRGIVHRAKGLFLIMGQEEWAGYATSLKKSAAGKVHGNLQIVVANIEKNFTDIIVLCD